MRKYLFLLCLSVTIFSCNKNDNPATSIQQYRNLVYKVQTTDSGLQINLMRAVYNDVQKGNIAKDSLLLNPGFYNIPATVLTGMDVTLFALDTLGPNFSLTIVDDKGKVLAATDTIIYYPANQLHGDQWISKITCVP